MIRRHSARMFITSRLHRNDSRSAFVARSIGGTTRVTRTRFLVDCWLPFPLGGVMNLESERAALMQTSRDWARTAATDDLERTLSFWSDDAIVMPPGQPAVVGKAAIREFLRQTLAIPGFSITWEPEQATVAN